MLPCLLWLKIKTRDTKITSSKMLLRLTQPFPTLHLHIFPHLLNRKGHQRPWSNRESYSSLSPRQFIPAQARDRGGWTQLGISWLWVPSRVNPLLSCYGLAFFSRQLLVLLNVREWVRFAPGTACLKNVLCDDLMPSGLNVFFILDLTLGNPLHGFCHCQI